MPQNSSSHNTDLVIATKSTECKDITPYNLTEEKVLQVIPKSQLTEETKIIPIRFQDSTLITEVLKAYGAEPTKHPYSNLLRDNIANVCTLKRLSTKNLLARDIPIEFIEWCRTQGIPIADVKEISFMTQQKRDTDIIGESTKMSTTESVSLNAPPPMVEVKTKITRKEKAPTVHEHVTKEHHSMLRAKYFNPTWWYKKLKEKEISLHAENNDEHGEVVVKFGRRQFAIHTVHKHEHHLVHYQHPTIAHVHTDPEVRQLEHILYEGHEYDQEGHPVKLNWKGLPEQIQRMVVSAMEEANETNHRMAREHSAIHSHNGPRSSRIARQEGDQVIQKSHLKVDHVNASGQVHDSFEKQKIVHM